MLLMASDGAGPFFMEAAEPKKTKIRNMSAFKFMLFFNS